MKWFSLYEFFHIGVEVLETTYIILKVEPDNYLNWLQLKDFFWWWIYFASICLKICIKSAVLLWYLHGDRFVCWFFIVYINYTMWITPVWRGLYPIPIYWLLLSLSAGWNGLFHFCFKSDDLTLRIKNDTKITKFRKFIFKLYFWKFIWIL